MSSRHSFWGRNWKLVVNLVTLGVLALLLVLIRDQIVQTLQNLGRVKWGLLFLMLPLVYAGYHAQVAMYRRLFGLIGHDVRYGFMLRVALELNFINQVFPSGGVSGISYVGLRMRGAGVSATQASLAQLMKLFLLFVSFEGLLGAGLLVLAFAGKVDGLMFLIVSLITVLLTAGTLVLVAIVGSHHRTAAVFAAVGRRINWVARPFARRQLLSDERMQKVAQDVYAGFRAMRAGGVRLLAPLGWALVVNLSAVLMIYVVYLAFGARVNLGAIIVAYSVANFAGLISVLPGGAGIYEALMVGVLAAGGIPAALSLPVTVMYRVLSTLIQLPPGYALYHQTVRRTGRTPLDQPHVS